MKSKQCKKASGIKIIKPATGKKLSGASNAAKTTCCRGHM